MSIRVVSAAPWSFGELAQATRPARAKRVGGGPRRVPQETVDAIREDAKTMPQAEVALRHSVSPEYVYQVVTLGLRSRERERLR